MISKDPARPLQRGALKTLILLLYSCYRNHADYSAPPGNGAAFRERSLAQMTQPVRGFDPERLSVGANRTRDKEEKT
jgi:hypothetical protein